MPALMGRAPSACLCAAVLHALLATAVARSASRADFRLRQRRQAPLTVPNASDTIPASYWAGIQRQMDIAGRNTVPPPLLAFAAPPTPDPYQQVAHAEQPYETLLGARMLATVTDSGTPTPPPTQTYVSQQFVARCPLVMFRNSLYITPPTCGVSQGRWSDPQTNRSVLRWAPLPEGRGLSVGVDSILTGPGSSTFATLRERAEMSGNTFDLFNCLNVNRYTIEEKTVAVHSMGPSHSTMTMHDTSRARPAYFFRYNLRHPNGTVVAKSNLFRMNSNQVNFTMMQSENDEDPATGPLLAVANRHGAWIGAGWRNCSHTDPRQWRVSFPGSSRNEDMAATVMDLRIASMAAVTLMALRDEVRSQTTGLLVDGSPATQAMELIQGWAIAFLILALIGIAVCVLSAYGFTAQARVFCFAMQDRCMPKAANFPRQPIMHPSW